MFVIPIIAKKNLKNSLEIQNDKTHYCFSSFFSIVFIRNIFFYLFDNNQ